MFDLGLVRSLHLHNVSIYDVYIRDVGSKYVLHRCDTLHIEFNKVEQITEGDRMSKLFLRKLANRMFKAAQAISR